MWWQAPLSEDKSFKDVTFSAGEQTIFPGNPRSRWMEVSVGHGLKSQQNSPLSAHKCAVGSGESRISLPRTGLAHPRPRSLSQISAFRLPHQPPLSPLVRREKESPCSLLRGQGPQGPSERGSPPVYYS